MPNKIKKEVTLERRFTSFFYFVLCGFISSFLGY